MLSRLHEPDRSVLQVFFDATVRFGFRGEEARDSNCKDLLAAYELKQIPNLVHFIPSVTAGLSETKQEKAVKKFVARSADNVKDILEQLFRVEFISAWNPLQDEHAQCSVVSVKDFLLMSKIVPDVYGPGKCPRTEEVMRRLKGTSKKEGNVFLFMNEVFVRVMMIFSVRIGLHADRSASSTTCSLVKTTMDMLTGFDDSKLTLLKKKCRCEGRTYRQMLNLLMEAIENQVPWESLTHLFLI